MTFPARCSFLILCFALAASLSMGAESGTEARITRVTSTTDVVVVASPVNNLGGVHLTKFMDAVYQEPCAVLVVDWRAPRKGLPAGAIVRLEYHPEGEDEVRSMDVTYNEAVHGDQTARFSVPLERDGTRPVLAWRIQVTYGGRVLDEKTSASWR